MMATKRSTTSRKSAPRASAAKKGKGATRAAPRKRAPQRDPAREREQRFAALGVALVLVGLLSGLAMLPSPEPSVIEPWLAAIRTLLGVLAPLAPLLMIVGGVWLVARRAVRLPPGSGARLAGALFFLVALMALLALGGLGQSEARAQALGGWLGLGLARGAILSVGELAAPFLMIAMLVAGLLLLFELSPREIGRALGLKPNRQPTAPPPVESVWSAPATEPPAPSPVTQLALNLTSAVGQAKEGLKGVVGRIRPAEGEGAVASPRVERRAPKEAPAPAATRPPSTLWKLPEWEPMLEETEEGSANIEDIRSKTTTIEQTLAHFGVPARVVEVNRGPTVTQYGVEPGYVTRTVRGEERTIKVKVSAITSLQHDLALALAAQRIRIEAPVPGHTFVGIEVPNDQAAAVTLAGTMGSEEFARTRGTLKVAFGRDVMGNTLVADLTKMPHLLIAGATGSGKSVCINAIIACLLCTHTPDQLKLMMVDPKMVELVGYNGIPHLIVPVVTEIERVIGLLRWTVAEMERRYKLFSQHHIRNIEAWNTRALKQGEAPLPYLVLVIDELADLMMSAADQVEAMICRLAQMARAVGIHLILATQRPSVDVVTGLIKANIPARLSFAVSSQIDSRVILDRPGAETLLGRGDMLYQAPDSASPRRAQGCFVSDREIERINNFWIEQAAALAAQKGSGATAPAPAEGATQGVAPVSWESLLEPEAGEDEEDELLPKAREIVEAAGSASVSMLQRRLRVGYARAARLIDLLEEEGTIGASVGPGKVRRLQREEPGPGSDDDPGFDPAWIDDE